MKVLVKEKIADTGVDLLRSKFDVDLGLDWSEEEFRAKLPEYDAILIRSATKMTAELIDLATNMKVIGRAGTGVDNVDIPAATRRGIIVANAPESNSVAAAEHTLALALALFRNVPQAQATLVAGRWDRAKFKGAELYGKTLGVIGFGRIGQLVARRAQSFDMEVIAYDKFVSAERFRELGVEGVDDLTDLLGRADLITLHTPRTPETEGLIDAEAIAAMKDGARIVNCARGELIVLDDLVAGLESGKLAGAALDVFPSEPFTEHPVFARDDVVVTPHLGASTAEAQDRAGVVTAEQVTEALTGGVVTNAVNIAAVRPEEMEALAPVRPALRKTGKAGAGPGGGLGRPRRGRVPRQTLLLRHPPARDRGPGRDPLRQHRDAGQPRQRAADGGGAGDRADRDEGVELRGLHRARHRAARLGRRRGRGRRDRGRSRRTSPTWSRPGARASTCPSPSTSRSSVTPTCRA